MEKHEQNIRGAQREKSASRRHPQVPSGAERNYVYSYKARVDESERKIGREGDLDNCTTLKGGKGLLVIAMNLPIHDEGVQGKKDSRKYAIDRAENEGGEKLLGDVKSLE